MTKERVVNFVSRRWDVPPGTVEVDVRPLGGGLESNVSLASVRGERRSRQLPRRLVVKELRGAFRREAHVYRRLWERLVHPPAARPFGIETAGDAEYLFLENVRSSSAWPWADSRLSAEVCRELAGLHDARGLHAPLFDWGYEQELAQSADATLWTALHARDQQGGRYWRRSGDLRRVVAALPAIRRQLFADGAAVIHGDVHPGNVILRAGRGSPRVVLIDWGRARRGSPLEDVASWLHSLGCWEPEARRRHDSLLRIYLESRTTPRPIGASLRRDYWFASASNGLAGAIRYHLAVLWDRGAAPQRHYDAWRALRAWERVIRRTAALVSTSPPC